MINQDTQLFRDWVKLQVKDPPKNQGSLEVITVSGETRRCCLGNLCSLVEGLPKQTSKSVYSTDELEVRYGGQRMDLPESVADKLGITCIGGFTLKGQQETWKFLRRDELGDEDTEYSCLMEVNDNTEASHRQIGELIQHLAKVEAEDRVEMFCKP